MSAIISKIISVFTSIIMAIFSFLNPFTPPAEDPYERIELPAYILGEFVDAETEDIIAFYNNAVRKTQYTHGASPQGKQMLKLISDIKCDDAAGSILKIATPVIDNALKNNNYSTSYIPGHGMIKADDVKDAFFYKNEDGTNYVYIALKDQVNGPDSDSYTSGPVSRGIGTLGSLDYALSELGATIESGRENIRLEYTNAYIICEINPETGYVLGGTWHYDVNVSVTDAKVKISLISANIKNFSGKLEYAVVLGE